MVCVVISVVASATASELVTERITELMVEPCETCCIFRPLRAACWIGCIVIPIDRPRMMSHICRLANGVVSVVYESPHVDTHKRISPGIVTALVPNLSTSRPPMNDETIADSAQGNWIMPDS